MAQCRQQTMNRPGIFLAMLATSLIAFAWAPSDRLAAEEDVSFAGKTISMTIGFGAGGSTDLYGRMLGRYLMRYLPGQPNLIVLNQLGAGGVVALNDWSNKAEPNGLFVTIGAQSQTDPDALIRTHAKFNPTTFEYVGGLAASSQGLFVNKDAVARLHDKSARPAVMGMVGSTLRSGNYQVLWGAAFLGWNVKWVRGYTSTAELRQAVERGEIDMSTFGSTNDIAYLRGTGRFVVVSQSGATARAMLGDAPTIAELVKGKIDDPLARRAFAYGEAVNQVGMWLALPPRTPERIVAAYSNAFEATTKDRQYQDELARLDPDSPAATRADLERLVHELAKVSPETLDYIQAELNRQGLGSAN
jgi:tripartite-type tricarboxylate transporter receptor subunit TctC